MAVEKYVVLLDADHAVTPGSVTTQWVGWWGVPMVLARGWSV